MIADRCQLTPVFRFWCIDIQKRVTNTRFRHEYKISLSIPPLDYCRHTRPQIAFLKFWSSKDTRKRFIDIRRLCKNVYIISICLEIPASTCPHDVLHKTTCSIWSGKNMSSYLICSVELR